MDENMKLTVEERRIKRIAQLKAKLQKEEAQLNHSQRKDRNGQLFAFGVMVEQVYKLEPTQRELIEKWVCGHLADRNLARAHAGFKRLKAALGETGD